MKSQFEVFDMEHHDSDATFECHFETYTGNLWHVYLGGVDLYNLLSPAVIQNFERQYDKLNKEDAMIRKLDMAWDERSE